MHPGEGGIDPKARIIREVAWILCCRSVPDADMGPPNPENIADVNT